MEEHSVAARNLLPSGSIPALVTPLKANGDLDQAALGRLIDWHVEQGSNGLVIMGTSAESPTMSMEEHQDVIALAASLADGRIPIIAGVGANATTEAIKLTKGAAEVGVVAGLSVVPYYNKPTQAGLYAHFSAIASASDLPIVLYNVPGRTVADLSHDTVLRLAEIPNIVGIKDATGDIERGIMLLRDLPEDFAVYSGDDGTAVALMLMGGRGNISVTANVAPALMARLCAAAMTGDVPMARALSRQLAPLHRAMFLEANPIPVKFALEQTLGVPANYRLPMTPLDPRFHDQLRSAMAKAGLG